MIYFIDHSSVEFLYIGSIAFCLVGIQILVDDNDNNDSSEPYYNYVGHHANLCKLFLCLLLFCCNPVKW